MGLASFALSIEDLMTSWKHEVLVPKLHLLNLVSKLKTASGEEGILIRFYTRRLMWCSNANYNAIPRNTSGYLSQWNVDCLYEVQSFRVSTSYLRPIFHRKSVSCLQSMPFTLDMTQTSSRLHRRSPVCRFEGSDWSNLFNCFQLLRKQSLTFPGQFELWFIAPR